MSDLLGDLEATHHRALAERPSPALPLVLLALVVLGGIGMTLLTSGQGPFHSDDLGRLAYWIAATLTALVVMMLVARRQGYRTGVWVNRRVLLIATVAALAAVAAVVILGSRRAFLPGDLTLRGNLPLLALAVGVAVWAHRESRPGLWVLFVILLPITLLANLYNMENIAFRLGIPFFAAAGEVVNLAVVAMVLLVAAGVFSLLRWRHTRAMSDNR